MDDTYCGVTVLLTMTLLYVHYYVMLSPMCKKNFKKCEKILLTNRLKGDICEVFLREIYPLYGINTIHALINVMSS